MEASRLDSKSPRRAARVGRPARIERGRVTAFDEAGSAFVELERRTAARIRCDVLDTGAPLLELALGDRVLIWRASSSAGRGCILGRVEPTARRAPARLVLQAAQELEIRCGEAEIVLRKDGRLLLRGVDVASLARRRQRIKGGSVEIN